MKASKKLLPGQPGTKKLVEKYGKNLVCVRYRNDPDQKRKYKTVELIEEEWHWEPNIQRIPGNKLVYVRIKYEETNLRKIVKGAGGRWNKDKKLWELPYTEVKQLGFTSRMVSER